MSSYKTHIFWAIVLITIFMFVNSMTGLVGFNYSFKNFLIALILVLIMAISPDIDHQSSKIRYLVTLLGLITIIYFAMGGNITKIIVTSGILIFLFIMHYFSCFEHRGIIHSLIFNLAIFVVLWWYLSLVFAIIGGLAYFSHLLLDGELKLWN